MHNNYHFLKHLAKALDEKLEGAVLSQAYSQSKNEVVMVLQGDAEDCHYLKFFLKPQLALVTSPMQQSRKKKNSARVLKELEGKKVQFICVNDHDRGLTIGWSEGLRAQIPLFGSHCNIHVFRDKNYVCSYKKKRVPPVFSDYEEVYHDASVDEAVFLKAQGDLSSVLPTGGKLLRNVLQAEGYDAIMPEARWQLFCQYYREMQTPLTYLIKWKNQIYLSLFAFGEVLDTFECPVMAANQYFYAWYHHVFFEKERQGYIKSFEKRIAKSRQYLVKTQEKYDVLTNTQSKKEKADVIMASLHQFEKGQLSTTVFDFYTNQNVEITLKPNQRPQQLAENLYRKHKNQKLEFESLDKNIKAKTKQIRANSDFLEEIKNLKDVKDMRAFVKMHKLDAGSDEAQQPKPFRRYHYMTYEVWVGKNAKANDEMLRRYAHKNDLWLHAKDCAGSHVLVKEVPGQTVPKDVKQYAASLAAFFSKRKSESLCPVICVPRKYAIKKKGHLAGQLSLLKESTVLVEPQPPL